MEVWRSHFKGSWGRPAILQGPPWEGGSSLLSPLCLLVTFVYTQVLPEAMGIVPAPAGVPAWGVVSRRGIAWTCFLMFALAPGTGHLPSECSLQSPRCLQGAALPPQPAPETDGGGRAEHRELVRLESREKGGLRPAVGRSGAGCVWVPPGPAGQGGCVQREGPPGVVAVLSCSPPALVWGLRGHSTVFYLPSVPLK